MTELTIRPSEKTDIGAIYEIYENEVLHGMATFDEIPPTRDELLEKRAQIRRTGFPHLVAEIDGRVIAYSYISLYRQRSAYSKTVENAIYVHPSHQGAGVGFKLMTVILQECKKLGLKNVIAVIGDSNNHGSIKLHKKLGFRKVGILNEVGFKFGRWVDVVIMQKQI